MKYTLSNNVQLDNKIKKNGTWWKVVEFKDNGVVCTSKNKAELFIGFGENIDAWKSK